MQMSDPAKKTYFLPLFLDGERPLEGDRLLDVAREPPEEDVWRVFRPVPASCGFLRAADFRAPGDDRLV